MGLKHQGYKFRAENGGTKTKRFSELAINSIVVFLEHDK